MAHPLHQSEREGVKRERRRERARGERPGNRLATDICLWASLRRDKPGNGKYHCTVDLLFDWFGISCMTNDNFCFYLQNRLILTSQTGGQQYNDTSALVFPGEAEFLCLQGCAHPLHRSEREKERERERARKREGERDVEYGYFYF